MKLHSGLSIAALERDSFIAVPEPEDPAHWDSLARPRRAHYTSIENYGIVLGQLFVNVSF